MWYFTNEYIQAQRAGVTYDKVLVSKRDGFTNHAKVLNHSAVQFLMSGTTKKLEKMEKCGKRSMYEHVFFFSKIVF